MERVDLETVLAVQKETNSTAAMVRKLDVPGRQEELKKQDAKDGGDWRSSTPCLRHGGAPCGKGNDIILRPTRSPLTKDAAEHTRS